jgi:hypothetical protein
MSGDNNTVSNLDDNIKLTTSSNDNQITNQSTKLTTVLYTVSPGL